MKLHKLLIAYELAMFMFVCASTFQSFTKCLYNITVYIANFPYLATFVIGIHLVMMHLATSVTIIRYIASYSY